MILSVKYAIHHAAHIHQRGTEEVFDQFEAVAIPSILKYNGQILLRIRPEDNAFIEHHIGNPLEINLVEINSAEDFESFKNVEERTKFLHLKEQSIKASILFQGAKL